MLVEWINNCALFLPSLPNKVSSTFFPALGWLLYLLVSFALPGMPSARLFLSGSSCHLGTRCHPFCLLASPSSVWLRGLLCCLYILTCLSSGTISAPSDRCPVSSTPEGLDKCLLDWIKSASCSVRSCCPSLGSHSQQDTRGLGQALWSRTQIRALACYRAAPLCKRFVSAVSWEFLQSEQSVLLYPNCSAKPNDTLA